MRAIILLGGLFFGGPLEVVADESDARKRLPIPSAIAPANSRGVQQEPVKRLKEISAEISRLRYESRQIRHALKRPEQFLLTLSSYTIDPQKLAKVDPELVAHLTPVKPQLSSGQPSSPRAPGIVKQLNRLLEQQDREALKMVKKEGDFCLRLQTGKTTKFLSGGEFPIPLSSAPSVEPQIEFRQFGIIIESSVQQKAQTSDNYDCQICFEISQCDFAVAVAGPGGQLIPGLQKRMVSHKVALPLGQTVQLHMLPTANSCWVLFAQLEELPTDVAEEGVEP